MIMFINLPKHKSAINLIQSHICWVNSHIPMGFLWFSYGFSWGPEWFSRAATDSTVESPARNVLQGWSFLGQISGSQVDVQGLAENSVPLNPMVLLIIIPTKWL